MYYFSIFVFGKLSRRIEPVDREHLGELIQWAVENQWSWSVETA
jgi:hypothetical protein